MHAATPVPPLSALRFALVGVANTLAGFGVIYALTQLTHLHAVLVNVCGYAVGLYCSYWLNARWTFGYAGRLAARTPHYVLLVAIAYLANLATVSTCLYLFSTRALVAQAAGVLPYTLITYCGSRWFVFANRTAARSATD